MTPEQSKALPLVKVSSAALKLKRAVRAQQAANPFTKSDFVRQHPNVPASALVALAAKQGLRLSTQLVYVVRGSRSSTPKRGPGRPRKHAITPAVQVPRRGPGRRAKADHAGLTRSEKELATLLLAVGLDRAEHVLAGLKRSTRA